MKPTTPLWIERQPNIKPDNAEYEQKRKIWGHIGIAALTAVVLGGAMLGIAEHNYSNKVAARMPKNAYSVDPTIESVTIESDAILRTDPTTGDRDSSNVVKKVGETFTVDVHNIQVNPDSDNGEWYGIPADVLKRVDPDLNPKGDEDGVIWVNTQRADVRRTSDPGSPN